MPTSSFDSKTAIVTGAAIGIGFEIARQLAAQGAAVVLNDVNSDAAERAVEKIVSAGGRAVAVPGDSSDLKIIDKMVEMAVSRFGRLDIAVANAGITTFGDFLTYPIEQFQRLVAVNLQGTFFWPKERPNR